MKIGIVVFDKNAYFYKYESNCIQLVKNNLFTRIIKKICKETNVALPKFIINNKFLIFDELIVTDSAMSIGLGLFLKEHCDSKKLHLYYMNPINLDNAIYMRYFKHVYTFDPMDAEKYNIKFRHTPFSKKILTTCNEEKWDCIFLGKEKGRGEKLGEIYDHLNTAGLRCNFMVYQSHDTRFAIHKCIPYHKYVDLVSVSKCIIEVISDNQSGCSLRYMESLFFKKKIITNNTHIVHDKYYNKNNVFIYGIDDIDKISSFVNEEYDDTIDTSDLELEKWLQQFC